MHMISHTGGPHRGSEAGRHQHLIHHHHFNSPDCLSSSPRMSPHFIRKHVRYPSADSKRSYHSGTPEVSDREHGQPDTEMNKETDSLLDRTDYTKDFVEKPDPEEGHSCKEEECQRVILNVSGMKFETQLRTLHRLPNTLLGDKSKRDKYWDAQRKEYFFDRHRPSFAAILYFYQSGGRLRRPLEVPNDVFLNELLFFELGNSVIMAYKESEGFTADTGVEVDLMPKRHLQRKIWELFEYPNSSIFARIVAVLSVIFIVTSVVTFCVETLPRFKNIACKNITHGYNGNVTILREVPEFYQPLFLIEATCMTWFIVEIVCRTISCPSKVSFFKQFINWIDIVSIAPFLISISMYIVTGECEKSSKTGAISVLRVLRVARILKLSKHSEGLQLLGMTLKTSVKELMMFVLFLAIGVVIFSGAIFYAEQDIANTHFHSIPGSFWWAVVTMTTVGYGDMYPLGIFGKVVGTLCVICGLLSIAFPVPVIVTNFSNYYRASTGRGSWGP